MTKHSTQNVQTLNFSSITFGTFITSTQNRIQDICMTSENSLLPLPIQFTVLDRLLIFLSLISHASKVMLKILQARLQQYVNRELPDVQVGFRKGGGTRDKLPTSAGSSKKQESSRKTSISALLTMPKPLTVWITVNCGKF